MELILIKTFTRRSILLLSSIAFSLCATDVSVAQSENAIVDTSDIIRLKSVLDPSRHLPDPHRVAFYEKWEDRPKDLEDSIRVLGQQKAAISEVKAKHLLPLLPKLIPFLDYPSGGGVPSLAPKVESVYAEALSAWPAYDAIVSFGKDAIDPLKEYIKNPSYSLSSRLTALQVLRSIDQSQAQVSGNNLALSADQQGQREAADVVKDILSGKEPFWGMVEYDPVTMDIQEVRRLLDMKKHFSNPFIAMDGLEMLAPGTIGLEAKKAKDQFDLYTEQKEAIKVAGKSKMTDLIPNLVLYMDYPSSDAAIFYSATSSLLQNRRRNFPALDAILNMGSSSIKPLEGLILDKKQDIQIRFTALSVLHDVDAKEALAYEKPFLDELKERKEDKYVEKTQYLFKLSAS